MPSYTASGNYPPRPGYGSTSYYRLDIEARTSEVAGGTLVEIAAVVSFTGGPGIIPAFGPNGARSWSLPGGREGSTSGAGNQSGSSTFSYNFANYSSLQVYNYFNRYIAYNYGSSTTLSVTVSTPTSVFFTSQTLSVTVPLFQPAATKYSLSYNSDGGSPTPTSQSLEAGASFTAASAPTKTGYVFSSWSGSDGKTYAPGDSGTMPSSALTLKAVWGGGTVEELTVGTVTQNSIRVSWERTSGVSYRVYLNDTVAVQSQTSGSHTFQSLTPGTTYSLGVAVVTSDGTGPIARVSGTTIVPDPAYAENANYATAKIGLFYSSSVTATNGQTYEKTYGDLPPGLFLATNGTISGTPEQREDSRLYFNEAGGYLDEFSFGVKATGPTGTSPVTKQFSIKTMAPGSNFTTETSPRSMIIARRWNGISWVPIQKSKKFDGESWIDLST
jgi:uncharacterized repeat protein (TIGR02543 family)